MCFFNSTWNASLQHILLNDMITIETRCLIREIVGLFLRRILFIYNLWEIDTILQPIRSYLLLPSKLVNYNFMFILKVLFFLTTKSFSQVVSFKKRLIQDACLYVENILAAYSNINIWNERKTERLRCFESNNADVLNLLPSPSPTSGTVFLPVCLLRHHLWSWSHF